MIALRLLGWFNTLKGIIARHPLWGIIAALALFGAYERHQAHKWQDRAEACQTASQTAAAQTKALRDREAKQYQEQAAHADASHSASLDRVRAATVDFARRNRVQPSGQCAAASLCEADRSGIPAPVPAQAVMVDERDVQACGDLYAYSIAARDWAMTVGQ